MAKELFEDIKTGKKEFLFCWESSSDNEKLKDFLQNSSIIDIETDKIKLDSGFVINIEPNDYFRKTADNKIELWKPKDMIKKFSYIGDTLIEEKSVFHVQDEEFRKKIYEKYPDITEEGYAHIEHIWLDFKDKIEKECPVLGDSQKDNLYKLIKFHSKFENFICELEDEYNISITKHFWEEFERRTYFKKDDSRYDVAEVLSDFPFEKYLKSEEEQKEFISSVFEFSDETEKWYKGPNSESTENYMKTLYSDEQGTIIFSIQRYYDGRVLELEFVTDRAEYNPYY